MRKKKIALVLCDGGFNCAFQLGALNYINENWKKITGLSTPMKFHPTKVLGWKLGQELSF